MDVLLCDCGHRKWEHIDGVSQCDGPLGCKCRKFKPFATFAQLREALQLIVKMAERRDEWGLDVSKEQMESDYREADRIYNRIRGGEKGGT